MGSVLIVNTARRYTVVFNKNTVYKQEAPLTLRGQRSRCRNIKGEPQILGVVFMVGLGKSQLHATFEVASFSRCTNIKGEPQNFGELH